MPARVSSLLTALLCAHLTLPAATLANSPPAASPVARVAVLEMQQLQASGGQVSREGFSRYFATYPIPGDQAEAMRLLGTAERILRAFVRKLYGAAEERARAAGATAITSDYLRTEIEQRLPSTPTEHKTRIFFPQAPEPERVEVETIDIEAFRHTPFVWPLLVSMMQHDLPPDQHLPIADDRAARTLAEGASMYGLLIFRLGGHLARADFATSLTSPNLREAEKAIARRATRRGDATTNPSPSLPQLEPGSHFVDVTADSGIRFRHVSSDWISHFRRYGPLAPTYSGGGVAAADLGGDGWPDLIYCGGEGCGVFRNRHDGTFEDVTTASGLRVPGEARMPLPADFDNDGDQDVFITYARDTNRLFENLGDGRFRDITERSGVRRDGDISGPAVAFDYDNDGLLDLYVGNFGNYLEGESPWGALDNRNGMPNRLYRNTGGLKFEDVTERSGSGDTGWSQALSHVDYDGDGDGDLYIANDFGTNELLVNQGDGTFKPMGEATASNDPHHGMNVSFTDLNRDTFADIFVTNIWGWVPTAREPGEYNTFLLSDPGTDGQLRYERTTHHIPGLLEHDTGWSWAGLFFDAENDGDDDLFLLNGLTDYNTFVQWRPHPSREGALYPISNNRERNVLFLNDGGVLKIPPADNGAELGDFNSRSLALLDYDRDGDLDLAISTFHSPVRLLRNDSGSPEHHWLVVELVGDPAQGVSRDAIGTQLIARGEGGLYAWRTVAGGEGYLGSSTLAVELGLGKASSADLEIYWPGKHRQDFEDVAADQIIRIRQGEATFEKMR